MLIQEAVNINISCAYACELLCWWYNLNMLHITQNLDFVGVINYYEKITQKRKKQKI